VAVTITNIIHNKMKLSSFILFIGLLLYGNAALAVENEEIEYLLSYIAASDCIFIRNGTGHQPQEAREHLEMKYNHVKSRITTAEDFINKIASKSSLSRRKYQIRCGENQLPTEVWLKQALAFHRTQFRGSQNEKK